jgi:hypothetical protein
MRRAKGLRPSFSGQVSPQILAFKGMPRTLFPVLTDHLSGIFPAMYANFAIKSPLFLLPIGVSVFFLRFLQ